MSSKDKENPLLKIRSFFKKSGGAIKERELGADLERELRPENPVAQRCKTLKDFGDMVSSTKLEDSAINKLWELTKDLIVDNKSIEHRQTTLTFYRKLIQGQYANLSLMREHFFLIIQKHDVAEDLRHRLDLLIALTENGKDITNFEEKIGKFMLQWAPIMDKSNLTEPYLEMLVNIIKFNAAHLDNEIVVGIVQHACNLSCTVEQAEIGLQCLKVLDAVICYTIFPNETLTPCVYTLCRTVNLVPYCQTSWKNMKMLLCTNLGYESLLIMCNLLKDKNFQEDETLLRGAVFHINMGVFGSNSSTVSQLPTFSTVLVSFLHALDSRKVIVTYEVILSIQMLIPKYGINLVEHVWDIICDILMSIADNIYYFESNGLAKDLVLQKHFHETIDNIEQMLQKDEISVKSELIYNLIEKIAESRPEISVLTLIEYRSSKLTATQPEWLHILRSFVQRFYKIQNTEIRIKTIQALLKIMDMNRAGYEEEILERVVIPEFSNILYENDINVRKAVGKALIDFAWHCDTKRCGELLDILEKILNRPFEVYGNNEKELEFQDVLTVVEGLIEVFMVKLYRLPSCHAIRIFNMLVEHLELHYQNPKVFEYYVNIRHTIFDWMLKARANSSFHIGYPDPAYKNNIKYSHYLGIDASLPLHDVTFQHQVSTQSNPETIPAANFTTISIRHACKLIVTCIEKEKDYSIFQLVLRELPHILQNKAIIQGNDIESLAQALFTVFSPKKDRKFFQNAKPSSDEFSALVLPAIASLVIYHQYLSTYQQQCIIEALKCGVFQRVANICINTLTIMILEMPEALMRKLPDVLLEMSKMTDTVQVAIPVLEFLSILNRLPNNLFANFVPVQYMYVFAITLPYTKPQRYDHYTVSLAHHVIAGWFLKCKLQFRKNFVTYIIQSIQTNSKLFEDNNKNIRTTDFNLLNEDSSNRKRSTSLTERGSRSRGSDNQSSDIRSSLMNESLKNFHAELAETCIDFLARHTFSPCSALPKRLPAVEYLLKDGPSQTWLVGQNLITITTNGCSSPPTRNGLCDRCCLLDKNSSGSHSLLKGDSGTPSSFGGGPNSPEIIALGLNKSDGGAPDFQLNRRYTKASLQYSGGTDSGSTDLTTSSSSSQQHASLDGGVKLLRQTTSNSSSGSLEALSRRGSNPDSIDNRESSNSMQGGGVPINILPSATTSPQCGVQQQICARSCTGWAEIFVRRPTGNISWIMRIQNPISNDCLGNDMPFNDLISLFLPVQHGGVFGPDFVGEATHLSTAANLNQCPLYKKEIAIEDLHNPKQNSDSKTNNENKQKKESTSAKAAVAKVRALKRQEEITSVSVNNTQSAAVTSGPIDIPKMTKLRCNKDPTLAGSFSDLESEDCDEDNSGGNGNGGDDLGGCNEDGVRSRNPVRRVNSSPEMSSSWRSPFMQGKQNSSAQKNVDTSGQLQHDSSSQPEVIIGPVLDEEQQQKKKTCGVGGSGYSKDLRVSCEAIPEEIAGSTPPSQSESLKDENSTGVGVETEKQSAIIENRVNDRNIVDTQKEMDPILPPKQHSADDVTNQNYYIPGSSSTTSLKIPVDLQKVTTKPPQSPAPLSPRLLAKNAANKIASFAPNVVGTGGGNIGGNNGNGHSNGSDNGDMRGRSKTISVVREVKNNQSTIRTTPTFRQRSINPPIANSRLGINPSFVFLQLFHTGQLQCIEMPIRVTPENMTALALFDYIPPFETHTISVLYVGPGQCNNEMAILKNRYGSSRYVEFLRNIGTLVSLKDAKDNNLFLNMETNGKDGFFTYVWKDDIVHVTFNVATLMPNLETDRNFTEKKKNIGNNYVSIVYNESGEDYNIQTVKGQFNFACIVVQPLELNTNRVTVKARKEIAGMLCHPEPMIVSDRSAPLLARQLALHANLASNVYQSLKTKNPYASNWLERLRKIKNLRQKLLKESQTSNLNEQSDTSGQTSGGSSGDVSKIQRQNIHDFTKYT